jgi:hypothetical protein
VSDQEAREKNEAAYRRLKPDIDRTYPPGRFVAIHEGEIVGDAPTFRQLDESLLDRGLTSPEILVVQAGVDYPDYVDILACSALQYAETL